jgi:hypothetical protein
VVGQQVGGPFAVAGERGDLPQVRVAVLHRDYDPHPLGVARHAGQRRGLDAPRLGQRARGPGGGGFPKRGTGRPGGPKPPGGGRPSGGLKGVRKGTRR